MKFLIAAAGSHGDVLPFLGLSRELMTRGHEVRLFASGGFAPLAAEAGVPFVEVLGSDEYDALIADRDVTDSRKGLALIARVMRETMARSLALLQHEHVPGRSVLVGSSLAWATRLLGEIARSPVATVHLSPSWLRSEHLAPSLGPLGHLEGAPRWVKRSIWHLMDRRLLDPLFTEPFNALRQRLGLPPVQRTFHHWAHEADLTLGLFPAWFAPPQPDWPALQLAGFPLYDHGGGQPLPDEALRFLDAGKAPVVFTAGTANASSHAFFETSVRACALSGRRGLLITHDAAQLPSPLPAGLAHFRYLPFGALMPRAAALVHHGGIGTTSQALLAGVPQLVRPMGFDQFDNARRVQTLGAGRLLLQRRYRPDAVARTLDELLGDTTLAGRCQVLAARLRAEPPGTATAADALLALATRRGVA